MWTDVRELDGGAIERAFALAVAGERVPGLLWTPPDDTPPTALIALGHGGAQHKRSAGIVARAQRYAAEFGWASLALDAPGHGARIAPEEAEAERVRTLARAQGRPSAPALSAADKIRYLDDLAARAVPEWRAALDAVTASGPIDEGLPLAWWGVSMGSSVGIPLLAAEPRLRCAVLGLAQLHPDHAALRAAAERVTVPLRFALQWDDAIRDRSWGLALFDAFGSREKSLHVHPGGHLEVPEAEVEAWDRFFERYLP